MPVASVAGAEVRLGAPGRIMTKTLSLRGSLSRGSWGGYPPVARGISWQGVYPYCSWKKTGPPGGGTAPRPERAPQAEHSGQVSLYQPAIYPVCLFVCLFRFFKIYFCKRE